MINFRDGLPFKLTVVDDPSLSDPARSDAPLARFKAVTGFLHSRTTTVLLGEPINAPHQSMTDGTTVFKLAWTLEHLVGVHDHQLRQPVERVKVWFNAEEDAYAGRGVEVLVDPSDECPRVELVFDRMLDCTDTRGCILSVLNAAAGTLAAGQESGVQREVERKEPSTDEREQGSAAGTSA